MNGGAATGSRWAGVQRSRCGDAAWRELRRLAAEAYRPAGGFARRFAHGKLRFDPVFRALLESGAIAPQARVLDIGCGQALLASLLCACDSWAATRDWPLEWAAAPTGTRYTGIELMPGDVARAEGALASMAALGRSAAVPQVRCVDMCEADLPAADAVVVLDVLHYIDHGAQHRLLQHVHAALSPGGRLLLRVGNAADRQRFAVSQWVDRVVTRVRGHRVPAVYGRTLAEWTSLLQGLGFAVEARPMSRGTPFANVLLVCRREALRP